MKRMLLLISDGVEECEALTTRDVLLRGGIKVDMKSITGDEYIVSQDGLKVLTDGLFNMDEIYLYDGVILPGGKGTAILDEFYLMDDILKYFNDSGKLLAAICAAPKVLGHRSLLKNKRFTSFKGANEGLDGIYTANEVEEDGNIITARSMYYSQDFGLRIIRYLLGEEESKKVENAIKSK